MPQIAKSGKYIFGWSLIGSPRDLELLSTNQEAIPIKNIMLASVPRNIAGCQHRTNHRDRDSLFGQTSGSIMQLKQKGTS